MEGFEEFLVVLFETLVGLVVQGEFIFDEGLADVAPSRVPGEEDDDVAVAVFPTVLDDVAFSRGFDGLDLDAVIIRSVGDEDVRFVPVI